MPDGSYTLDKLTIQGFRAYLRAKTFDFTNNRCLAVFAPNGSGKSSLVDALEFLFSENGTLERLGLRTVNNSAGPIALAHNMASDEGISPLITAVFSGNGSKNLEASRAASGNKRPRPAVADTIRAGFMVDPIIRGYALRSFVEGQTAEKRYEDVARWLQLGPLVGVQSNIRMLRQQIKASAEDRAALDNVDALLAKRTGNTVDMWDDDAVLKYVDGLLASLDKSLSLKSLDRTDSVFIEIQHRAAAEEERLGLQGLRQLRNSVLVLYGETAAVSENDSPVPGGLLLEFLAAIQSHADALAKESAERTAAANAAFDALWKAAEPLFAEGERPLQTCPVCVTVIADSGAGSADAIRQHLAAQRRGVATYASAKKASDEAKLHVATVYSRLISALKSASVLTDETHATVKLPLQSTLGALDDWNTGPAPDIGALVTALRELTATLDAEIAEITEKQGEATYVKMLAKLDDLLMLKDERREAMVKLAELYLLSEELNVQAGLISAEIRKSVQSLLDTLRTPINEIYRQIQGESAVLIRLELPSEEDVNQQRLNLLVDFAKNRSGVQPSGYLSDSQVHSLAFALRLAGIKCFNKHVPIIVLDDVVTSYDADHRRAIASLLATAFSGFQFIVTTHDERFFIYLKDNIGDKGWHYTRIVRLDPDFGPRFVDHKITDQMISARWNEGESAANEMRQAEEEWLLGLCRDFGVDVRIRAVERAHSYERSELASALAGFLSDSSLVPPPVLGVNNRFLGSLQNGVIENFGSHFQDGPYGDGSKGDEQARWDEFKTFRSYFVCPKCHRTRFKRPLGMAKAVCAHESCETPFEFIKAEPNT